MTRWHVNESDTLINEHLTERDGRYIVNHVWYLKYHLWSMPLDDFSRNIPCYNVLLLTSHNYDHDRNLLTFSSRVLRQ